MAITRANRAQPQPVPRVSVLMPAYNTARFLPEALQSIVRQTFRDVEIIVIDDGSTDGSGRILHAFAAAEPRMRLVCRPNRGLIATRNELLLLARGELVAWMDSDDVSLPERLALQVAAFDADPSLSVVGGVAQCIDPEGNALNVERYPVDHDSIRAMQQQGGGMRFPTTMVRRSDALRAGWFREPFRLGEDLDFLLRIGEFGRLANLPNVVYLYRQHLTSVCTTLGPRWTIYRDAILALANERREQGADRLQRGEALVIAATSEISMAAGTGIASDTYMRWSHSARLNGNRPLALRYARAALRSRTFASGPWKTLIRALSMSHAVEARASEAAR